MQWLVGCAVDSYPFDFDCGWMAKASASTFFIIGSHSHNIDWLAYIKDNNTLARRYALARPFANVREPYTRLLIMRYITDG